MDREEKFLDCIKKKRKDKYFHISTFLSFTDPISRQKHLETPVSITSIVVGSFLLYSFLFIIISQVVHTYRESDALQCPTD